jgi:hypothetical protein
MRLRRWAIAVVAVTSLSALSACGSSDSNTTGGPSSGGSSGTSSSVDAPTGSGDSGDSSGSADSSDSRDSSGSGDSSSSPDSSASGDSGASSGSDVGALTAATLGLTVAKAMNDAGSAHMEMTAGSASGTARISGDIAGLGEDVDARQMSMKMNIHGLGVAQMRIVDSAFYVRVPSLGAGSKSWLKIPLDDPNNPLSSVYSQLVSFTDAGAIRASFSAFKKFTDLGIEKVDGVQARHYRVTVDTVKALKQSGLGQIGGVPMRELLKATPKQTTSDLWIDSDNRIVKMSSNASAASFEIRYSKWGKPVHVSAPPRGQVQPLPGL